MDLPHAAAASREEFDESLLRLYGELGRAYTYAAVLEALRLEIEHMLGYKSMWLQLIREPEHDLLTLDSSGPVIEVMKTLLKDDRYRLTLHGEDFVVVPIGDDPWLREIMEFGDVHVTPDAQVYPLTNKDLIAITGQCTVVCVPLILAERTLGYLNMGTFFDEGVLLPDEKQLDFLRRLSNHVAVALDRVRFLGERAEAEAALERMVAQLEFSSFLLDSVIDGVIVRADDGRVIYVNEAMCSLAGATREQLLNSADIDWACVQDRTALRRHLDMVRGVGEGEIESTTEYAGVPVVVRSSRVDHLGTLATLSLVSDISERKAAQAEIEHMALHDPLTDLANRALLRDRLALAVAHARRSQQPLALVMLDLDHFKAINDTTGHATGDLLLQEIAQRLRAVVRVDDTVARFGGDEFTLVLPDIGSIEKAAVVAEKILAAVREPVTQGGHRLAVTASLGVALYECDDVTAGELLRNGDLAMYCAKEEGRDRYRLFDRSMTERSMARFELTRDLEEAVARRELEVHFQPIVDLVDGSVRGAEALCRWTHRERGPIPPATFIPLAEESGVINELGEWVLREACRQAAGWQQPGRPIVVSVNLSPRQLGDCDLCALVCAVLDETGLPPSALQLEVTESMAVRDAPYLTGAFGRLREMGVRIAIDDFGTGYASLDYLTRFPVDALKVDRVFVRGVVDDPGCRAVAAAVASMARALGIEAIAEGIETDVQRLVLLTADCRRGQGYLFSAGIPAQQFAALVSAGGRLNTTPEE